MEYKLEGYLDKRKIPLSSNTIKIDFDILQDLVFEANQQDKYTTKKDIAKKYSKITKYKTRLESPRALDILNLLETPKEKVDRVFENILSSSEPVDLKYIKTAKVKAASDASAWRSKLAQDTNLDISFTNRVLNNNPNYIKNKKLFDYLSASQLLKTELKDMTLSEQLKYADQAILGRPQYTGMTMSKAGKGNRLLRDPAHKVMEFALRNFNQNKGQGVVKFFDSKGKLIKYKPGIKIPYQKSNFSYGGKKHYIKDLRKPGYMQKFFPEVYENQTAINKLLNKEVDNPFKKGKKIIFGDLMNKIQVKGYGWSPQAGVLDVLHGSNGVINEPFTNLSFGTRRLNTVLRDIEVGKYGKGLKQKLVKQAFGDLKNLKGDELMEGIVNQQLNIAKQVAKGKTFEKPRVQVAKELLKSNVPLGNRESIQLKQLIFQGVKNLPKNSKIKICRALGTKDIGGITQSCEEAIRKDPAKTATIVAEEIDSIPNKTPQMIKTSRAAKTLATTARSILKGTGLTIAGEIPFEAAAAVNPYKRGKPGSEILDESILGLYGIGRDLNIPKLEEFVNNTGQTGALDFYNYYKNQNTLDQLNEKLERTDPEDPSYGMLLNQVDNLNKTIENTSEPTDEQGSEFFNYIQRRAGTFEANKKKRGKYGNLLVEGTTQKSVSDAASELNPYLGGALDMFLTSEDPYQYGPYGLKPTQRRKLNRDPEFKEAIEDYTKRQNLNIMYPTTGTFAKGGLANLTTTVAPQSGPNSKGLESLRKYATKTY